MSYIDVHWLTIPNKNLDFVSESIDEEFRDTHYEMMNITN